MLTWTPLLHEPRLKVIVLPVQLERPEAVGTIEPDNPVDEGLREREIVPLHTVLTMRLAGSDSPESPKPLMPFLSTHA